MATVFVLDDQARTRLAIRRALGAHGHRVLVEASLDELRGRLRDTRCDLLIVADSALPAALHGEPGAILPPVPAHRILVTTEHPGDPPAARLRDAGVYACLAKPIDFGELAETLGRCLEGRNATGVVVVPAADPGAREIVHAGPQMSELMDRVQRLASVDIPVLITGESGTGKELIARALHSRGPRAGQPFVAINCGAIPPELLESELFGHEKGSFTDATRRHLGKFEQAGTGTLFLDEIGEMPLPLQVKLLRVLQEREVQPVGSEKTRPVRARIVAATNRDLTADARSGRFRQDLMHRLAVVTLEIPPLRDRPEDLMALLPVLLERSARQLRREVAGLTQCALSRLTAHRWPGNVRELEHVLQRAVLFCHDGVVREDDLPTWSAPTAPAPAWEQELATYRQSRLGSGVARAEVEREIRARVESLLRGEIAGDNSDSPD